MDRRRFIQALGLLPLATKLPAQIQERVIGIDSAVGVDKSVLTVVPEEGGYTYIDMRCKYPMNLPARNGKSIRFFNKE